MKNYVKTYQGYAVPEGATHFSRETHHEYACFYRCRGYQPDDWEVLVMKNGISNIWMDITGLPSKAVELPEVPKNERND